jgi:hypothetical protein
LENQNTDFFRNLRAITDAAFPKHCKNCGMTYNGPEDFIAKTESLSGKSGLKSSFDDSDATIVELYRNCICGSTLMDFFSDRRDNSEKGAERRRLFDKLLQTLESRNVVREVARIELLKILRGEKSELIESLGLTFKRKSKD